MSRSLKKGPFTDDHLANKVAAMNAEERKESGADLVAAFDHPARIHRAHAGGPQRQEVHSGVYHRKHGGAQAGRIFADAPVPGAFGEGRGSADHRRCAATEKTAKPS